MVSKKRKTSSQPTVPRKQLKARTNTSTKLRTTFHTPPREIRQAIFFHAHPYRTTWTEEKEWIAKTAATWRQGCSNSNIIEDIEYVEGKMMEQLTRELKEAMGWDWAELSRQEIILTRYMAWPRTTSTVVWTLGKPIKTCLVVLKVPALRN